MAASTKAQRAIWMAAWIASGCGAERVAPGEGGAPSDRTAPSVLSSDPDEGQLDAFIDAADISVTFDEPMDVTISEVVLRGGAHHRTLTGSWSAEGQIVSFSLSSPLVPFTTYRLDLGVFRDVAGNILDGAPYLGDGWLDFTTADAMNNRPPHVVSSIPVEGSIHLDTLTAITLTFSEAMDPALAEVALGQGSQAPETVSGVWGDGDTVLTVPLAEPLTPGATFHLDVSALGDRSGYVLDDAHPYLGDGVLDFTLGGHDGGGCDEPLLTSQAIEGNGFYTWYVPATVSDDEGQFACDANGAGPGVVIEYTKTSPVLADGGELLHVIARGNGDFIDLEIVSGDCAAAAGAVETCVSNKSSWDSFLDVPAGTYWIWVASEEASAGGFPDALVSVEEVPASALQAQGEGCFAPYTTASANHVAPVGPEDPHVWTIPPWINAFDIAASTAGPGAIRCNDDPEPDSPPGVDAVVEFQKAASDSSIIVEVEALEADLDDALVVEVRDGCDPVDAESPPVHCTTPKEYHERAFEGPAGPYYLWVATNHSYRVFPGAEIRITELTPALGEMRTHPEPLSGSGPIQPTSPLSVEVPSCFSSSAPNVHWYSYVVSGTLFGVAGDTAAPIAVFDTAGNELACATDTTSVAIGSVVTPGSTAIIAVEAATAITHLEIVDDTYAGVGGTVTGLGVTFPAPIGPTGMTFGATEMFVGTLSNLWSFPKTGGAVAVEYGAANGITASQLGYDLAFAAGRLFSLSSDGSSATDGLLWALYDASSNIWAPMAWDVGSGYPPATYVSAMTYDGTDIVIASDVYEEVSLFAVDPTTSPAVPVQLGANPLLRYVTGVAADAAYFYVAGQRSGIGEGIYRIDRANVAAPPQLLRLVDVGGSSTAIVVDDLTAANTLYVHDSSALLHVVANPSGPLPVDLGSIRFIGGTSSQAMTIDRATNTLYLFDPTLPGNGGILTIQ